jgi:hypothetical protein
MDALNFSSNEIISDYDELGNLIDSKRSVVKLSSDDLKSKVANEGFRVSDSGGKCILYKHESIRDRVVETSFCLEKTSDLHLIDIWNGLLNNHLHKHCF